MGVEGYGNEDDIDSAVDDDDTDGGVDTATEPVWTVQADDEVGNADDDCWSAWSGDGGQAPPPVTDGRWSSGSIIAMAVTGGGGGGGVCEREDAGEGDRLSGCS